MLQHSARTQPQVVITHALRTPIGKFLGAFRNVSAVELGVWAIQGVLRAADLPPAEVDEVLMGQGRQAGSGPNPCRQASVRAGIPQAVPAWTLNMACASGLKAIVLAQEAIRLGRARIVVAGGMETMSGLPFLLPDMRQGYRLGHAPLLDSMYRDGFQCPIAGMIMGETADKLARERGISRAEQDAYAAQTQLRYQAAFEAESFADEIIPVEVPGRRGEVQQVTVDEHPRAGVTIESLAKLPAVFDRGEGTVTAGNSSGITDGAAAVLVMSREEAERRGYEPLAVLGAATQVGVDATAMGIGPVPAVQNLCRALDIPVEAFDVVELNEAFAAQVLACQQDLRIPPERLNPLGGAIALGHPIGATGARIVVTLLHQMRRGGSSKGLATLCVSGGMGMAVSFDRT